VGQGLLFVLGFRVAEVGSSTSAGPRRGLLNWRECGRRSNRLRWHSSLWRPWSCKRARLCRSRTCHPWHRPSHSRTYRLSRTSWRPCPCSSPWSLGVFGVFAAAGHSLGIFALAASHGGMVRSAGSLALVLLSFMVTAATGGLCRGLAGVLWGSGSLRSWCGLPGSQRQPGRESND